jgi:hypothetical protein
MYKYTSNPQPIPEDPDVPKDLPKLSVLSLGLRIKSFGTLEFLGGVSIAKYGPLYI